MSRPLQISPETAVMLSKKLGVPLEHLMHMPKHILMQKMAELAKAESGTESGGESAGGTSAKPAPGEDSSS